MPQRRNNTGKPSGPYNKQDGKKPATPFKKPGGRTELKEGYGSKGGNFKSRSFNDNDPNELAPPRFLPPKDKSGSYVKKGPGNKFGSSGRGPAREDRGFNSGGNKTTYKGKDQSSVKGPYRKPGFSGRDDHNKPADESKRPYRGKEGDSGNYSKPTFKKREQGGFNSEGDKKAYRGKESDNLDFRKPAYKKREEGGFGNQSEKRPYRGKEGDSTNFRKPEYKKREDNGYKSDGGKTPYRGKDSGAGDGGFRKSGFQGRDDKRIKSDGGNSGFKGKPKDGDTAKPFRPKYDPQVVIKKTYTERKKELTGAKDDPDDIRLNKYIANSGVCSRREADELIKQGLVSINGAVVTEMGYRVKKTDLVKFDGRKILPEPYVYILMNKPKDFITTTEDEKGRKTVMDLLADKISQRVYPIGRLDRNTTGVLLLTNDGEVAQALTHPSFQIKKVYHVVLDKKVNGSDLDKLVEGVELEDGQVHADAVAFVDNEDKRHVGVEIHSGKNRVVRRMFEHLGYEVEKLDRVSMGIFTKKDLPRGKWRFLKESEIGFLMKLKANMP